LTFWTGKLPTFLHRSSSGTKTCLPHALCKETVGPLLDDCAVASGSQLTLRLAHDINALLKKRLKLCGTVRSDGLNMKPRLLNQPRIRCSNSCVSCRVTKFTHHLKPDGCVSYSLAYCGVNPLAENLTDPEKSKKSRQNIKWPN
jgi:hypothetical protein